MKNIFDWLQGIFADDLCNGDWEHGRGITISTLDNPGWSFRFDLHDTDLENIPFHEVKVEVDENNWYLCRVEGRFFEGFGGPKNLSDIIEIFKQWYEDTSLR